MFSKSEILGQINFEDEHMKSLFSQLGVDVKNIQSDYQKIKISQTTKSTNATSPITKKLFDLIDTVSEKNLRTFVDLLAKYGKVIQLRADLDEKKIDSISNLEGLLEYPSSEGVYSISADVAHENGITGKGVKVAVLDLSFDTSNPKITDNIKDYQSLRKGVQGDLIQQSKENAKIQAHGTAVAEVITDVAPDVELYLYEMDTDVEFAAAVDRAISNNVDIIAMAAGWPNLATDGTSHITKKVEEATSHGISFIVPSGNFAKKHWEGTFVDSNLNGWNEFAENDEGLGITVSENQVKSQNPIIVYLTWDTGLKDIADFDLALIDPYGSIAEYSSTAQKSKDASFSEYVYFVPQFAGTYLIGISYAGEAKSLADVPSYAKLELFSVNNQVEHAIVTSSVTVPADAKGVISVGAVNHMTGIVEPFSSQGPTNNAKQAPFIVGPDGVTTLAYNGELFYGTSATTPYIAGVTALLLQMNPNASPEHIQELLKKNAELNNGISDNQYSNSFGYGTIDLSTLTKNL